MDDSVWNWEGSPWKTRSSYMSFIRGGIRRGLWNKNPVKLYFLQNNRKRIKNPIKENRKRFPEVWGAQCDICKQDYAIKDIEVDHIGSYASLKTLDDIELFIKAIVLITPKDLRLLCKDCHKIASHASLKGISFQEAKAEKVAILLIKDKRDKTFLSEQGITPASNQKGRRQQIIEVLCGRTRHCTSAQEESRDQT